MHGDTSGDGDLGGKMGRSAEPVDAQTTTRGDLGALECTEPDDARTQQRRGLDVVELVGQPIGVVLRHRRVLGVATVVVPTREPWSDAQILTTAHAEATGAARVPKPGDPYALADTEA